MLAENIELVRGLSNGGQLVGIKGLAEANARLDAADVRLDKAFRDLAAAKGRLASEAAADYTLLQNEIDRGVGLRDKEAAALRSWAKDETAAIKASLTTTQNLLNAERDRLQIEKDSLLSQVEELNAINNSSRSSASIQEELLASISVLKRAS
jgi:hypothetical protein